MFFVTMLYTIVDHNMVLTIAINVSQHQRSQQGKNEEFSSHVQFARTLYRTTKVRYRYVVCMKVWSLYCPAG